MNQDSGKVTMALEILDYLNFDTSMEAVKDDAPAIIEIVNQESVNEGKELAT